MTDRELRRFPEIANCARCRKPLTWLSEADGAGDRREPDPNVVHVCNACARLLATAIHRPDLVPAEGPVHLDRDYFDELRSYL